MAPCSKTTLLDVIHAVSEYATSEAEIVATVTYLINSGKVRLCGTFAGARIDLATPASTPPRSKTHSVTFGEGNLSAPQ